MGDKFAKMPIELGGMEVELSIDDIKKVIDFLNKSDYEFYSEMRAEMSEEEFEEYCKEFPEARMVL